MLNFSVLIRKAATARLEIAEAVTGLLQALLHLGLQGRKSGRHADCQHANPAQTPRGVWVQALFSHGVWVWEARTAYSGRSCRSHCLFGQSMNKVEPQGGEK